MMTPEHRMSLELKQLELRCCGDGSDDDMADLLDGILHSDRYIDVLDECDATLHYKYHLIYAVGTPQRLACGEIRWLAAEALLSAIASAQGDTELKNVLLQPHFCFQDAENQLGGFNGLRLSASVENKDHLRSEFRKALILRLMHAPPFSLLWLKMFASRNVNTRDRLVQGLSDPNASLDETIGGLDIDQFRDALLALRGLVAFGILEHCLEKRHRVEYGLPDHGTRKKRMAIPFHAADIPSERSEFSHPEVCIMLTLLGYYNTGITLAEFRQALKQLLCLGLSEQDQCYTKWYDAVKCRLSAEDMKEVPREARQLCPRDSRQVELLYRLYRGNMEAINFFLITCVFPNDTTQFPQRLCRSAWNLAEGTAKLGFSGTNDNHRLLPLSVRQHEPDEPSLQGTNGKMVDLAIRVSRGYEVIWPNLSSGTPWQQLLQLAIDKKVRALIDTGVLLAGVLSNDAAVYLLELPAFAFADVTYYDTRKQFDCWVVPDAVSKLVTPLKKPTILERETFVIFDDARSRGSDMKLDPDAVAVLTLGPKLTKDKFMQGAGRMRQLGFRQALWLVSLGEVAQSVSQVCEKQSMEGINTVDVLDWVMHDTKFEAILGLLEWAASGLHFSKTQQFLEAELIEEDWSLESLYLAGRYPQAIAKIVRSKAQELFGHDVELNELMTRFVILVTCSD